MNYLILFAVAVIPGIYLIYRYYSKDIYKKEPWIVIWKSFFWGAMTVLPAGFIETALEIPTKDTLIGMIIENFFIIALTEEICKFIVIRYYSYRSTDFDETMDGIVYGVAVASGFATFENIFYVMQHGFAVGMLRAVISVPSHIFEGAIIGYWLAKSRFQNISIVYASIFGLTIAVIGHGFFDFVLTYNKGEFFYLSIIPVVILGWLVRVYVKDALAHDVKYIHKTEVSSSLSESTPASLKTDAISFSEPNPNIPSEPYLKKIIRISLYFLGIVSLLTAAFLLLGFVTLWQDGKEELWTISLPLIPFLGGLYFLYTASHK